MIKPAKMPSDGAWLGFSGWRRQRMKKTASSKWASGFSRPEVEYSTKAFEPMRMMPASRSVKREWRLTRSSRATVASERAMEMARVVKYGSWVKAVEGGEQEHPERMRVDLHALADVPDQAVALDEVINSLQGNKGVVAHPGYAHQEDSVCRQKGERQQILELMVGQFAEDHGRHQNRNGRDYKDRRRCLARRLTS
jgi:hypothetical protein